MKTARTALVSLWLVAAGCRGPVQEPPEFVGAPEFLGAPELLGAVSSASPEATEAGRRILEAGGNAIDAAVAVSFALGVTEPAMSGLGGQTQILLFSPERGAIVINGTSFSPRATPTDATKNDLAGRRATTVPTTVKVLDYAHRLYGSGNVSWRELVVPAIEYAENGFSLGPFRKKVFARHAEDPAQDGATETLFGGQAGEIFRQPVLAETLRRIASEGADIFYHGTMAREIADDMERNGGWIRYDDLAELAEPNEIEPLRTSYRGYEVLTLPPPGGGWVVLQMLEMLETFDPAELTPGSADRVEALARVLHLGHRERGRNPVMDFTDYSEVDEKISREAVRSLLNDERGETTHFSVVDGDGMAVAVTASINAYYGARVAHPTLGFLYNDYMNEFEIDRPGHPFELRAEAMPYSSMSPTILTRDSRAQLVLGSPGSARIISAVTQVIQLWVDADLGIEEAVAYPRLHVDAGGELYVESTDGIAEAIDALVASGLERREPANDLVIDDRNAYFGGVHAIAFENGVWAGAADPRRDGTAAIVELAAVDR